MRHGRLVLTCGFALLAACNDIDNGSDELAAYLAPNLWELRDIPVCFNDAGTTAERAALRATLRGQRSWASRSAINFVGWKDCTSAGAPGVAIEWDTGQEEASSTGPVGDHVTITLNLNKQANNEQYCYEQGITDRECRMSIALHEFGHAIGFAHEYGRTDKPAGYECQSNESTGTGETTYGPYDTRSIMTPGCSKALSPSPLDLDGAAYAYGLEYASVHRAGDFDGDLKADRLCRNVINGIHHYALASGASAVVKGCSGDRTSLYVGEFTGNGIADTLCHDRTMGDIVVTNLAGEKETWPRFCTGRDQHLLVGDFDGNGTDDLLCHDVRRGLQEIDLDGDGNADDQAYLCSGKQTRLVVGNFDGKYGDDLACLDIANNELLIDANEDTDGLGSVDAVIPYGCGKPGEQLRAGDFNGDGKDDLLCHNSEDGRVAVDLAGASYFGVPDWSYGPGQFCFARGDRIIVGDYDADGYDEVLCHNIETGSGIVARPHKGFEGNTVAANCTEPGEDLH